MIDKTKIKIDKVISYPDERDWLICKECTLTTVGKKLKSSTNEVDLEWKKRLLASEHSPIRELWFRYTLYSLLYISSYC